MGAVEGGLSVCNRTVELNVKLVVDLLFFGLLSYRDEYCVNKTNICRSKTRTVFFWGVHVKFSEV